MTKRYRSEALAAVHETMGSLYKIGTIDKKTMRRFDEACLTVEGPYTFEEIMDDELNYNCTFGVKVR